ncbi:MAG: A/G-specific adenine glycosylase [Treponema sp.]|nr:A/G-specific adenine glycosylase [Treponema sp.]
MSALTLLPDEISRFQKQVWDFYNQNGRSFPWRNLSDSYAVLVSEMMLQQTQTLRVLPKYTEWMRVFPTAQALAQAPLSEVLSLWNGLGYNRRAVFLQKACQYVCDEFGGIFPTSQESLEKLPGVGPYTAGAVSTFAHNLPNIFIETNIRSVYIHFFFADSTEKVSDRDIEALVRQTLDAERPREWYYALMDLGADIKKRLPNPSRKSKQYARQSRFEGSLRQARGAILRQLAEKKRVTLSEVSRYESVDIARLEKAAEKLIAEHLIAESGDVYTIPD